MPSRRKKSVPLQQRLTEWADRVREKAIQLPPGSERDALLKKVRQADTAAQLNQWAPGQQAPE